MKKRLQKLASLILVMAMVITLLPSSKMTVFADSTCPTCNGTKNIETNCSVCNGTGKIDCKNCNGGGSISGETCSTCNGTGKLSCTNCVNGKVSTACETCNGTGTVLLATPTVDSISMESNPTKTSYVIGESLDLTGAKITVIKSDNLTEVIDVTSSMVSGFDNTTSGTKTVTVTYEEKTTSFDVTVSSSSTSYTATFDINEDLVTTSNKPYFDNSSKSTTVTTTTNSGEAFTNPTDSIYVPSGYEFDGWYTEKACTNLYDFTTAAYSDITLYAKWSKFTLIGKSVVGNTLSISYSGSETGLTYKWYALDNSTTEWSFGEGTLLEETGSSYKVTSSVAGKGIYAVAYSNNAIVAGTNETYVVSSDTKLINCGSSDWKYNFSKSEDVYTSNVTNDASGAYSSVSFYNDSTGEVSFLPAALGFNALAISTISSNLNRTMVNYVLSGLVGSDKTSSYTGVSVTYDASAHTITIAATKDEISHESALTFTAGKANTTIKLKKTNSSLKDVSLQYSLDGNTWNDYTIGNEITLSKSGDKVYFKAKTTNATFSGGNDGYYNFVISGKAAASGDVTSLIDANGGNVTLKTSVFYGLFYNCTGLTSAPNLPSTTLAESCYENMFYGCTKLTSAPNLPATTLAKACYRCMFCCCTSLASLPNLPASTLATSCYEAMFNGCTCIKLYATKPDDVSSTEWSIPNLSSDTEEHTSWNTAMFDMTGGDFKDAPVRGTIYYFVPGTPAADPTYTITKADTTNGSFTVKSDDKEVTSATEGDEIIITPSANTGYEVNAVKYNDGTTDCTVTEDETKGYAFNMPAKNVTVTVTFKLATSGIIGGCYWAIDDQGKFTITPTPNPTNGYASGQLPDNYTKNTDWPWDKVDDDIKTIEIADGVIAGNSMQQMFFSCENLISADLTKMDTSKVTSMDYLFDYCSKLTSANLSGLDVSKVTKMYGLFMNCDKLTNANVSGWDTSNVQDMGSLFNSCYALETISGLSGWDTSNATDMRCMFYGCKKLTNIDVSNFSTANVTSMRCMFKDCSTVTALDLSNFDTAKVTDMYALFGGCSALTSLNLSKFNTAAVKDMGSMFKGCSVLTKIVIDDDWTTDKVTSSSDMFTGCSKLVGGKGTVYDANHTDKTYARADSGSQSSTPGYLTGPTKVSVTTWAELQAAIASVDTDERKKIKIENDITATESDTNFTVSQGDITIDLNGYKIDRNKASATDTGNNHMAFFVTGGKLTIEDSTADETTGVSTGGMITGCKSAGSGGAISVTGGQVIMNSGKICGNTGASGKAASGVYIDNASFTLNGGKICDNKGGYGAGVFVQSGTFNMTGGAITGNEAYNGGGAVEIETADSTFKMSGGSITDNTITATEGSMHKGAGIHFNKGTLNISGSAKVTGNTCSSDNQASNIYIRNNPSSITFTVSNLSSDAKFGIYTALAETSTDNKSGNEITVTGLTVSDKGKYINDATGKNCICTTDKLALRDTPVAADFVFDDKTGTITAATGKTLGTITVYYKVGDAWTTTKPTADGTYAVGVITAGSDDYIAVGTATEPFTADDWKYDELLKDQTAISSSDLTPTAETIYGKGDGKITIKNKSANDTYEYSTDGGKTYITVTGDTIENLPAGTVKIRKAAKSGYNASPDTEVTIGAGSKIKMPALPTGVHFEITADPAEGVGYGEDVIVTFEPKPGYTVTEPLKVKIGGKEYTFEKDKTSGKYTAKIPGVKSEDDLKVTELISGCSDTTAPEITVKVNDKTWNAIVNTITFGIFANKTQTVTATVTDAGSGLGTVQYYVAHKAVADITGLKDTSWKSYTADGVKVDPSDNYIVYFKATDKDGNVSYASTDGITIDAVAPTVTGITSGGTYTGDDDGYTFKIPEDDIKKVTIKGKGPDGTPVYDGTELQPTTSGGHEYKLPLGKFDEIIITDESGNTTTITNVTVNQGNKKEDKPEVKDTNPDKGKVTYDGGPYYVPSEENEVYHYTYDPENPGNGVITFDDDYEVFDNPDGTGTGLTSPAKIKTGVTYYIRKKGSGGSGGKGGTDPSDFVAITIPKLTAYTISLEASPEAAGIVAFGTTKGETTATKEIYEGQTVTITATAKDGYTFKHWINKNTGYVFSDGTVTGTEKKSLIAVFEKIGSNIVSVPDVVIKNNNNTPLVYNGQDQVYIDPKDIPDGVTITGTTHATNPGTYEFTLTLPEGKTWSDGTTDPKKVTWSIVKKDVDADDDLKPSDIIDDDTTKDDNDNTIHIIKKVTTPTSLDGYEIKKGLEGTVTDITGDEYTVPKNSDGSTQSGTYYIRKKATDTTNAGQWVPVTVVKDTVTVTNNAPSEITATTATLDIKLSDTSNVKKEVIKYRKKGDTDWTEITISPISNKISVTIGDEDPAIDTPLEAGTEYEYCVETSDKEDGSNPTTSDIWTFKTEEANVPTGKISCGIANNTSNSTTAIVTIESGNTAIASQSLTVAAGESAITESFSKLADGVYNLVVRAFDGEFIETRSIEITNGETKSVTFEIKKGQITSKVEIKNEDPGVITPPVAVDGLKDIITKDEVDKAEAGTQSIDVTLKVTAKDTTNTGDAVVNTLNKKVDSSAKETISTLLDLELTKTTTTLKDGDVTGIKTEDIGYDNTEVLEIAVPFTGKLSKVLRLHNSVAENLKALKTKPAESYVDGTYYVDTATKYIFIYASGFSSYALVTAPESSDSGTGSNPGTDSGNNNSGIDSGTTGISFTREDFLYFLATHFGIGSSTSGSASSGSAVSGAAALKSTTLNAGKNGADQVTTTNLADSQIKTWAAIETSLPTITSDKLKGDHSMLHVNIINADSKVIPLAAVSELSDSKIAGLHVFVDTDDAVSFSSKLDYSKYSDLSFAHTESYTSNSMTVTFAEQKAIGGKVVYHTVVPVKNATVKIYKVTNGKKKLIATTTSDGEMGRVCFSMTETGQYVLTY